MLDLSTKSQWMIALYVALVFFVLVNPLTFRLVNVVTKRLGFPITNGKGCPNGWGLILHGLVLFLAVRFIVLPHLPQE